MFLISDIQLMAIVLASIGLGFAIGLWRCEKAS